SVVREINRINDRELDIIASGGASWHDEYKDSAYIFIGGLHFDLTEGDVITIFSQRVVYGEVMDVNLPRDKNTGKTRGFGFLMYEDQRSTVLAVDNLNGANVLGRVLRVDHVKNYKQPGKKGEDGEWIEPEEQSLNAKPPLLIEDDAASDSSVSSGPPIDPEDPMYEYLVAKRKEEKALKKTKKHKAKGKHKDETPEERRARKERKKEKKAKKAGKSEGMRAVEELLAEIEGRDGRGGGERTRSPARGRSRSRTPVKDARSRSRTPERRAKRRFTSRSPSDGRPRDVRSPRRGRDSGDSPERRRRPREFDFDRRSPDRDDRSRRYRD
ncbi:RNA-binding domain-containing protein, partial [Gloeophyllum trabeum ATCC 11539]